ncbi:MAG: hypothetical protein ABMA64_38130 [Myxococcota bacterium]
MNATWNKIKSDHPIWFSPAEMRFFRSQICYSTLQRSGDGWLFVSSERGPNQRGRRYTVRRVDADGVSTVGGFQAYASRAAAIVAQRRELALAGGAK